MFWLYVLVIGCESKYFPNLQEIRSITSTNDNEIRWPNIALLINKKRNIQCTSTLISSSWAITSYSCIAEPSGRNILPLNWRLYAGSSHLFSADNSSTQFSYVKDIITHPQVSIIIANLNSYRFKMFVNFSIYACFPMTSYLWWW